MSGLPNSAQLIATPPSTAMANPPMKRVCIDRPLKVKPSRMAAIGGTVVDFHAGLMAESMVTTMPTRNAAMNALGEMTRLVPLAPNPAAVRIAVEPERDEDADAETEDRRQDAHDQRLAEHRPGDLPRAGPDGPQQGQLLHPLAHDDRERVADEEGGHEQGDAGEAEQDVAERVDDAGSGRPGCRTRRWTPGRPRLPAGRMAAIDCCTSSTCDVSSTETSMLWSLPSRLLMRWASGSVNAARVAPFRALHSPKLKMPETL